MVRGFTHTFSHLSDRVGQMLQWAKSTSQNLFNSPAKTLGALYIVGDVSGLFTSADGVDIDDESTPEWVRNLPRGVDRLANSVHRQVEAHREDPARFLMSLKGVLFVLQSLVYMGSKDRLERAYDHMISSAEQAHARGESLADSGAWLGEFEQRSDSFFGRIKDLGQ